MRPLTEKEQLEVSVATNRLMYQVNCLLRAENDCRAFPYSKAYEKRRAEVTTVLAIVYRETKEILERCGVIEKK